MRTIHVLTNDQGFNCVAAAAPADGQPPLKTEPLHFMIPDGRKWNNDVDRLAQACSPRHAAKSGCEIQQHRLGVLNLRELYFDLASDCPNQTAV